MWVPTSPHLPPDYVVCSIPHLFCLLNSQLSQCHRGLIKAIINNTAQSCLPFSRHLPLEIFQIFSLLCSPCSLPGCSNTSLVVHLSACDRDSYFQTLKLNSLHLRSISQTSNASWWCKELYKTDHQELERNSNHLKLYHDFDKATQIQRKRIVWNWFQSFQDLCKLPSRFWFMWNDSYKITEIQRERERPILRSPIKAIES